MSEKLNNAGYLTSFVIYACVAKEVIYYDKENINYSKCGNVNCVDCARKLFNEVSTSKVRYEAVDDYQNLLKIINSIDWYRHK